MSKSAQSFKQSSDLSVITTYQAGVMQAATHRSLQRHCDEILKVYGITKMQWLIIGTVLDAGDNGIRITELAETMGTNLPYMTNTINALETKKCLLRHTDKDDSRAKLVRIDPRFAPKSNDIEATLRQALRESIYAKIDPHDFLIYMKVVSQLSAVGTAAKAA